MKIAIFQLSSALVYCDSPLIAMFTDSGIHEQRNRKPRCVHVFRQCVFSFPDLQGSKFYKGSTSVDSGFQEPIGESCSYSLVWCVCVCVCARARVCAYVCVCVRACMHACIHTCLRLFSSRCNTVLVEQVPLLLS